jgi:outer membrane protein assembly factor BamE (lipoprotein component of BamABCDE complex)
MYRPKSGNEANGKNVPQMLMIQFDNDKIVTLVTYSEQGKSDLSKGKPINKELVARIKEGKTTEADILVMFGEPQMKQSMKGSIGDNLMYVYQYMPNIGIGKGTEGMNGRQMLRISFDTDNIVTTFNYVGP